MDYFYTSYLPSFPNANFTVLPTFFSGPGNEHGHGHENFTYFLQHAQGLEVDILPLVWEPALEEFGREGATGLVNESGLNAQTAFAFKRFKPNRTDPSLSVAQFRDLQYSAMINEMTILSCPPIKSHNIIVDLFGVGFELSPATGEVWPMLIFYKFNQGDLATYMCHAQDLEGDILLGICGKVAKGVQVLHNYNIVHGDIKPMNILISQDIKQDFINVGLADFGFSRFSKSEDELVYLPRSEPWEAPEWHTRAFSLMNAKKMDIYSFGLLCLWMFFKKAHLINLGFPLATINTAFLSSNQEATVAIQTLKNKGDAMLNWALELLRNDGDMKDDIRSRLEQVFRLTLLHSPKERDTTMEMLVQLLSPPQDKSGQMYADQLRIDSLTRVAIAECHGGLSVDKLFFQLESCDYRIHSFLVKSLSQMIETVDCELCCRNAIFQLSLCYALGFGVIDNEQEIAKWLSRSERTRDELDDTLKRIKEAEPDATSMSRLFKFGYRPDLPSRYKQDGVLSLAIERYRSMILARQRSLGRSHFSTLRLKGILTTLLRSNNQFEEALDLSLDMIEKEDLRPADMMELKSTISSIYYELGENANAESIEREILETYGSDQWKGDTNRLESQINLVDILISQSKCEDAKELGQKTVQECIAELGIQHASTRAAKRSLAAAYDLCGELAEALRTTEELVQSEEQYSKLEHINPKLVEDVSRLGVFYYRLGRNNSALSCYDRVQGWIKRNVANATYAVNSVNNQATKFILQGAMSEAKSILEPLLRECTEVLGLKSEESALIMGNLAFIYHSEKVWNKAEHLMMQVINTRREILGPSHRDTLTAMGNYRALFLDQEKFDEALDVAKEEIACVKNFANAVDEAVIDATITISSAFESAGAFEDAIRILEEASSLYFIDGRGPQQGVCRAIVQKAACNLQLGQLDKAREDLSVLFNSFQNPFKEDLNVFIPEMLRLAQICQLRDCAVEAKQVLNTALIFSQKGTTVADFVKDEVIAMASKYNDPTNSTATQLSPDQSLTLTRSVEEKESDGAKRSDEANVL